MSPAVHKMLFSCTWVLPKVSAGVHMSPGTKQKLLPFPVLVSQKIESETAHSVLKSLAADKQLSLAQCMFVVLLAPCGQLITLKNTTLHEFKYGDQFIVKHQIIDLLLTGVSECWSITGKEQQQWEPLTSTVRSIYFKEQCCAMLIMPVQAISLHMLCRTTFSKEHTSYSWKSFIVLEYPWFCIHIIFCTA